MVCLDVTAGGDISMYIGAGVSDAAQHQGSGSDVLSNTRCAYAKVRAIYQARRIRVAVKFVAAFLSSVVLSNTLYAVFTC